jgi:hypothetical protein
VAHNTKYTPSFSHHLWAFDGQEVVLLDKIFNAQVIKISTYFKIGCEILTLCPLIVDFNQLQQFQNYLSCCHLRKINFKKNNVCVLYDKEEFRFRHFLDFVLGNFKSRRV